jgi:hypothetical protein
MTDTTGGPIPRLPFELTLGNLDEANKSLLGMFGEGGPLLGESPQITDDDFRGIPDSFSLTVKESLKPLFESVPEGTTPNEKLKDRANTLLRHAINYQG